MGVQFSFAAGCSNDSYAESKNQDRFPLSRFVSQAANGSLTLASGTETAEPSS